MNLLINLKKGALIGASTLILLLATFNAYADVYLYLFFHDDNSTGERFRTAMPNMKTCLESLKYAKLPMPTSPSGDYEVIGAMWCGTGKFNRNYNATWWNDEVK